MSLLHLTAIGRFGAATILIVAFLGMSSTAAPQATWDFERDPPGRNAPGFTTEQGRWEVANDGANRLFAQRAENRLDVFNLALIDDTSYKNIDVSVRIKAAAGENEGGGGVVWRAKDKENYYLASYNPLVARHNPRKPGFRLYKVESGKLTQLDHADAPAETLAVSPGEKAAELPPKAVWHTLRITMHGSHIVGYLDGKKLLEAEDSTFLDVGKIGLWTKSDARTYFDDLNISSYQSPESPQ